MYTSRRKFLRDILVGSAGLTGGFSFFRHQGIARPLKPPSSTVYFRTGSDRRQMIYDVLSPLEDKIRAGVGNRQIIIKPNFVTSRTALCASHVDAARGVLDVLKQITDRPIIIAESPASGDALHCFDVYGYQVLTKEYSVRLVDLNAEPTVKIGNILQSDNSKADVRFIKTLLDKSNYIISLSLPKTHDTVVATLTTKNMIMASPLRLAGSKSSDKVKMHGGRIVPEEGEILTKNMFYVADRLIPDLAVLDGFEGMEGNGPVRGTAVEHRVALAGTDCIAVDAIGIKLMGFDPHHLPYLGWCGNGGLGNFNEENIHVDGPKLDGFIKKYKPADTFQTQIDWIGNIEGASGHHPPSPHLRLSGVVSSRSGPAEIEFSLPLAVYAKLQIVDSRRQRVSKLLSRRLKEGHYSMIWDGRDDYGSRVPAGSYTVQLQTEHNVVQGKISVFG